MSISLKRLGLRNVLFGIGIGLVLLFLVNNHASGMQITFTAEGYPDAVKNTSLFREAIEGEGGFKAYKTFAGAVRQLSPRDQHTLAHLFGSALYEVEGSDSLAVCDTQFSYGCFHEFLGRAILDLGLSSVVNLNAGCVEALGLQSLSCQHGIGHGVVAFLGYGRKELEQALSVCSELPYNDPIGGCYGGVFMEYNLHTMQSKDVSTPPPDRDNPMAPCEGMSNEYMQACVFWQPQRWHQLVYLGVKDTDMFKKIGTLCRTLTKSDNKFSRICFEGIGNIVPPAAGFSPTVSIQLCDAAGNTLNEKLFCRSYAANSITVGGAGMKGNGVLVCEGLTGEHKTFCEAYARNEANLVQTLPLFDS